MSTEPESQYRGLGTKGQMGHVPLPCVAVPVTVAATTHG